MRQGEPATVGVEAVERLPGGLVAAHVRLVGELPGERGEAPLVIPGPLTPDLQRGGHLVVQVPGLPRRVRLEVDGVDAALVPQQPGASVTGAPRHACCRGKFPPPRVMELSPYVLVLRGVAPDPDPEEPAP
eukprot:12595808-Heterocapsa_arctica.AAC.1